MSAIHFGLKCVHSALPALSFPHTLPISGTTPSFAAAMLFWCLLQPWLVGGGDLVVTGAGGDWGRGQGCAQAGWAWSLGRAREQAGPLCGSMVWSCPARGWPAWGGKIPRACVWRLRYGWLEDGVADELHKCRHTDTPCHPQREILSGHAPVEVSEWKVSPWSRSQMYRYAKTPGAQPESTCQPPPGQVGLVSGTIRDGHGMKQSATRRAEWLPGGFSLGFSPLASCQCHTMRTLNASDVPDQRR